MNITITEQGGYYTADCTDLPGSPPIGYAVTKPLAVASLMLMLMYDQHYIDKVKTLGTIVITDNTE